MTRGEFADAKKRLAALSVLTVIRAQDADDLFEIALSLLAEAKAGRAALAAIRHELPSDEACRTVMGDAFDEWASALGSP